MDPTREEGGSVHGPGGRVSSRGMSKPRTSRARAQAPVEPPDPELEREREPEDDGDTDEPEVTTDDDDEPEEEKLESQVELEAAVALQKAENAAALRAHDDMMGKAKGGRLSAEKVRKEIERARQAVRKKHLLKRKPGIYTAQPLTTINEKGERIQCPTNMRLPDQLVARLKKARDLTRLIDSGVLEDLR